MKESEIQRQILDYLKLIGVFSWRNQNAAVYDPTRKAFRSHSTMKGLPDILGVLPGGKLLAFEVKKPGGRVSPEQAAWMLKAKGLGARAIVVYSLDEAKDYLDHLPELKGNA